MKIKKKKTPKVKQNTRLGHLSQLEMTHKDIKREVIIRGMPFQEVVSSDVPGLYTWWNTNRDNELNKDLLDEFDDWMDAELTAIGRQDLVHGSLRFNYVGEKSEEVERKPKVIREKKEKRKREKNSLGLYSGTKKAMVYESQAKGWSVQKTIRKVKRAFPDAQDKSIKIWYNKAAKGK